MKKIVALACLATTLSTHAMSYQFTPPKLTAWVSMSNIQDWILPIYFCDGQGEQAVGSDSKEEVFNKQGHLQAGLYHQIKSGRSLLFNRTTKYPIMDRKPRIPFLFTPQAWQSIEKNGKKYGETLYHVGDAICKKIFYITENMCKKIFLVTIGREATDYIQYQPLIDNGEIPYQNINMFKKYSTRPELYIIDNLDILEQTVTNAPKENPAKTKTSSEETKHTSTQAPNGLTAKKILSLDESKEYTTNDIKKAYHGLILKFHPDKELTTLDTEINTKVRELGLTLPTNESKKDKLTILFRMINDAYKDLVKA
jgi:hypothetical protein